MVSKIIDSAGMRPVTDNQMAIWDDVAVELTPHVDVGVWVWSSSDMGIILFSREVTLGTEGGEYIEGTACFDLFWRQAV